MTTGFGLGRGWFDGPMASSSWRTEGQGGPLTVDASEAGRSAERRILRTALYVDFDNVYIGLSKIDKAVAQALGENPALVLGLLRDGRDDEGAFARRFLVRDCYLNPHQFGRYRASFVAAGFRVIDCPSLTGQGKNSADIHIVLDAVDALGHATRYDEFIICSADADFRPLMMKLRRHDRRTVMVSASQAAPAYEAVCDSAIGPIELVEALSDDATAAPKQADAPGLTADDLAAAATAVRESIKDAQAPVPGATAAEAAQRRVPGIAAAGWGGPGGFAQFVARELPELELRRNELGSWLVDPERHTTSDLPRGEGDGLIASICRVTRSPRLSSEQYAALFTELAEVAKHQPQLTRMGADVRDRTSARGQPVGRGAANFVVQGLVYAGVDPRRGDKQAHELAQSWRDNLLALCRQAGMPLSDDDATAVSDWVLGEPPPPVPATPE